MDHIFTALFPYIMTVLGTVLLVMLTGLLKRIAQATSDIADLKTELMEMKPSLVTESHCKEVRADCLALNRRLILEPLSKDLDGHIKDSIEHWNRCEGDCAALWANLRSHLHTKDGVILAPRRSKHIGGLENGLHNPQEHSRSISCADSPSPRPSRPTPRSWQLQASRQATSRSLGSKASTHRTSLRCLQFLRRS